MLCPSCHLEMRISGSRYEVENDQTPDTPTQVYVVQTFACLNPQCGQPGGGEERVLVHTQEQ